MAEVLIINRSEMISTSAIHDLRVVILGRIHGGRCSTTPQPEIVRVNHKTHQEKAACEPAYSRRS